MEPKDNQGKRDQQAISDKEIYCQWQSVLRGSIGYHGKGDQLATQVKWTNSQGKRDLATIRAKGTNWPTQGRYLVFCAWRCS